MGGVYRVIVYEGAGSSWEGIVYEGVGISWAPSNEGSCVRWFVWCGDLYDDQVWDPLYVGRGA